MSARQFVAALSGLVVAGGLLVAAIAFIRLTINATAVVLAGAVLDPNVWFWGMMLSGSVVPMMIALLNRPRSDRSAGSSAPGWDDRDAAQLGSAHYPRAWLLRGQWPGADRRYVP